MGGDTLKGGRHVLSEEEMATMWRRIDEEKAMKKEQETYMYGEYPLIDMPVVKYCEGILDTFDKYPARTMYQKGYKNAVIDVLRHAKKIEKST